jgi:hypothetical protein
VRSIRWEVMPWILVVVILLAFFGAHELEGDQEFTRGSVIASLDGAVTITTLFGFIFGIWGWRCGIFRHWLVLVPDLSGCWTGTIKPVDGVSPEEIATVVNLRQSLLQTSVSVWTAKLKSASFSADLYCDEGSGERRLTYSYAAWPYLSNRDGNPIHEGTALLTVAADATLLAGKYWTDRRTRGEIELRKRSSHECKDPAAFLSAAPLEGPGGTD